MNDKPNNYTYNLLFEQYTQKGVNKHGDFYSIKNWTYLRVKKKKCDQMPQMV